MLKIYSTRGGEVWNIQYSNEASSRLRTRCWSIICCYPLWEVGRRAAGGSSEESCKMFGVLSAGGQGCFVLFCCFELRNMRHRSPSPWFQLFLHGEIYLTCLTATWILCWDEQNQQTQLMLCWTQAWMLVCSRSWKLCFVFLPNQALFIVGRRIGYNKILKRPY